MLALLVVPCASQAQRAYFVDGYHGGIYGHYPVEWKTQFMVDKLAEHPEWRICLEIEPETWDTVKLRTPAAYENFSKIATDKRVEFTNPAYAQPYCYNISGESIIRQFQYGIRSIRRHFPGVGFNTYSVEEPCFTSSLPQILSQFGFKYAVLKCPNTCWGGYTAPYGGELVNWIGPDGTSILTVPRYACEELEENSVWQTTAWGNSSEYLDACFAAGITRPVGMTFQDAGWKNGPWIGHGEKIRNNSVYVTWREYIEEVSAGRTDDDYRFSQEDMRVELMWGSQVLQRIARQVRHAENMAVTAEKIAAMTSLENGYEPDRERMDEAWRTLMMAQHHDSWIVPYNRLTRNRTWANEIERWTGDTDGICAAVVADALESFGSAGPQYLRVYNTLGMQRAEIVSVGLPDRYADTPFALTDACGNKIPYYIDTGKLVFRATVPPFGYSTYRLSIEDAKINGFQEVRFSGQSEYVVENDMYRLVLDASKGGTITSLTSKKAADRDYVDAGAGYGFGEIRGHFYKEGRFLSSVDAPAEIEVTQYGELSTTVKISGHIGPHPFTQFIRLRQGGPRIDFLLTIDWQGNPGIGEFAQRDGWAANRRAFSDSRYKLNVLFPAALTAPTLYKDAPFDVCESALEDTFFNSWDGIKHNIILNWVDLAEPGGNGGLALLTDHTTSYSYGPDFPLGLTLQYSGNGLWNRDYPLDRPTTVRYALIPHSGKWDHADLSAEAAQWNEPLQTAFYGDAALEDRSFIDTGGTGYQISAAIAAPDGLILRLFNADGDGADKQLRFGFPVASVDETDLNGTPLGRHTVTADGGGSRITLAMPRFGIRTYHVKTSLPTE